MSFLHLLSHKNYPGPILCHIQIWPSLISTTPRCLYRQKADGSEGRWLSRGHTARQQQSQDSNPGLSASMPHAVSPLWLLAISHCEAPREYLAGRTILWRVTVWQSLCSPQKGLLGTSLVAQWLRIHLPMQGTWVWALVREDPTCCRATKPVCNNYWACVLEPMSHNYWAHVLQLLKPAPRARALQQEKPPQWEAHTPQQSSPCSPQLEKACAQQRRPNAAKN